MTDTHTAHCFCGAIEVNLTGVPEGDGLLPLRILPTLVGRTRQCLQPVATKASVRITKGEDQLGSYAKTPASVRRWCRQCGGHALTEHPAWGLVDVYAAVIDDFAFAPGVHVNYQETVLPIRDGVTKLKDLPEAMGGSGVAATE